MSSERPQASPAVLTDPGEAFTLGMSLEWVGRGGTIIRIESIYLFESKKLDHFMTSPTM